MLLIKQFESEMTLWDVNGITLKKKRPKKIKTQVEYMQEGEVLRERKRAGEAKFLRMGCN